MLLRLTLLLVVCLVATSQAAPQPIVRKVLRGVGGVVGKTGRLVSAVGEGVGEVIGSVGQAVAGDEDVYQEREDPARSLAAAAESLQNIAKQGNSGPQIIIQQSQAADVE